jgi:hypothetical protein
MSALEAHGEKYLDCGYVRHINAQMLVTTSGMARVMVAEDQWEEPPPAPTPPIGDHTADGLKQQQQVPFIGCTFCHLAPNSKVDLPWCHALRCKACPTYRPPLYLNRICLAIWKLRVKKRKCVGQIWQYFSNLTMRWTLSKLSQICQLHCFSLVIFAIFNGNEIHAKTDQRVCQWNFQITRKKGNVSVKFLCLPMFSNLDNGLNFNQIVSNMPIALLFAGYVSNFKWKRHAR